jgi:hypothetical protein
MEMWKRDRDGDMLDQDVRLGKKECRLLRASTGRAEDSGERSISTVMAVFQ